MNPYWPVVSHPVLRRVWPGLVLSALGDGMSEVGVGWLALRLAPAGQRGIWVACAVAAYSLPGVVGALGFGRFLHGRGGAQLAGWNALLRAAGLGGIALLYALGALPIGAYVALLGISALLASWGSAGRYALIAELLPERDHLPANAVLGVVGEFATIAGPPLAGLLIVWGGPATVIAVDAATFAVLAATYRLAVGRPVRVAQAGAVPRELYGVLVLTFGFFFLFGPVYVALPVHVADELHASAVVLGLYYTVFGVGALLGAFAAGYLRSLPPRATAVAIVLAFGIALLPLGLGVPPAVGLVSFGIAGMVWAPYMPTVTALLQNTPNRTRVLTMSAALAAVAVPLGTLLGGPLVTALGARTTFLCSACATVTWGVGAAPALCSSRRRAAAG